MFVHEHGLKLCRHETICVTLWGTNRGASTCENSVFVAKVALLAASASTMSAPLAPLSQSACTENGCLFIFWRWSDCEYM